MLNERQKKIIRNIFFTILTLLSLLGLVCYVLKQINPSDINDVAFRKFVEDAAPYISILSFGFPIIIGFFVKYLLGKHQQNQIEQTLKEHGVEVINQKEKEIKLEGKIKRTTKKIYENNGLEYYIDKNGSIIIVNKVINRTNQEVATILEQDNIGFIEAMRQKENTTI